MLKRSHLPSVLAVVLLFTLSGCKEEGERPAEPGPVLVAPIVAAGKTHSLAVRDDGSVWAWGINWNGELGDGTYVHHASPAQVPGLSSITALAAGLGYSIALRGDGSIRVWGANSAAQLGEGSASWSGVPMQPLFP
jgi:alpha-tubulin suppressor-like RCC1 family protein